MRAKNWVLLVAIAGHLLVLSACSGTGPEDSFFVEIGNNTNPSLPEEYAGRANPYNDEPEAIAEGEILYQANCSSCHGNTGEGDGPASGGLEPPPQSLAVKQSNLSDAYLFWRISEGGLMNPFNSLMPGFKGLLSEEKIWQIISYIRTLISL
jgi:mono/diheme cytochrome c family protein